MKIYDVREVNVSALSHSELVEEIIERDKAFKTLLMFVCGIVLGAMVTSIIWQSIVFPNGADIKAVNVCQQK